MSHVCAAPGCAKAPARADVYCAGHRSRLKRYGHPLQQVVTTEALEPFACRIASRLPDDGEVRVVLVDRWSALLASVTSIRSTGIVRSSLGGLCADRPATSVEREGARLFLSTVATTTAKEVADIVIGLTLLRAVKPDTFIDDNAFRFIVARRFFGLSTTNAARHRLSGSTTYRTFPASIMNTVFEWLWSAFGEVAEKMVEFEIAEAEKERTERERLLRSLSSL